LKEAQVDDFKVLRKALQRRRLQRKRKDEPSPSKQITTKIPPRKGGCDDVFEGFCPAEETSAKKNQDRAEAALSVLQVAEEDVDTANEDSAAEEARNEEEDDAMGSDTENNLQDHELQER
jgi:hypothetical protein